MLSGWNNRFLAWKSLNRGPGTTALNSVNCNSLREPSSMLATLGMQGRGLGGCPRSVPPKSTLRLGSESKECTRRCSHQALIRSASNTEEKQANVGCFTEVIAMDSAESTPLVLRWVESGQHTLALSHQRVKESRTLIYQLLWVHEFKVMPGVFNSLPLCINPMWGSGP